MTGRAAYTCLAIVCAFLTGCNDQENAGAPLISPYIVQTTAARPATGDTDCPAPPLAPPHDLFFDGVYKKSDPHRATVDRESRNKYEAQVRDLRRFESDLVSMSNAWLRAGDLAAARCATGWLQDWAQNGALLGKANSQGNFVRQWVLATLSSAWLQLRAAPRTPEQEKEIEKWLASVAKTVVARNSGNVDAVSRQNNHLYWAAWAVTVTGIALDRREFYEWGVSQAKYALHVQVDGRNVLPLEMDRRSRALQYHVFALAPLVMIAETALRNGEDLYKANDRALQRLVRRSFDGIRNPAWFEKETGAAQEPAAHMYSGHFSWMEAYNARFPDAAMQAWLEKKRPVFFPRTGGDMTLLFKTKKIPEKTIN